MANIWSMYPLFHCSKRIILKVKKLGPFGSKWRQLYEKHKLITEVMIVLFLCYKIDENYRFCSSSRMCY